MGNESVDPIAVLQASLRQEEERLADLERQSEPIRENIKRLTMALRDLNSGTMGSGQISDDQIVSWLKKNSSENTRCRTPEIAAAFNGDGRGFSRRLPRMAREGLIAGDSESGYYIGSARVRARAGV